MKNDHVLIIGAGLCGTLLAIRMAQRGYHITLCEKRPDMRRTDLAAGRSINLALSNRGLKALKLVDLENIVRDECIPMHGRMIHTLTGEQFLSKYSGRPNEYINSVSRSGLNIALLNAAETYDNIDLRFDMNCSHVDLKNARATFNRSIDIQADVIIGTDGAGSVVRRGMMSHTTELLFNYSQDFLRHGYKELTIPPAANKAYRIEKNALHIWPRGNFMIIALPNLDGSFTVTMFHPYGGDYGFDALDTREKVKQFFEEQFPDLPPHAPTLLDDYFTNPVGTLGTIRCYPWQAFGKALIMGDAAHAIVPFYGQGMNASFEDVTVFDGILDKHEGDWKRVFTEFQDTRQPDANAIAELAVDNFHEMRDHVANPVFLKKRQLEMQLEQTFPDYYSKYSLVTFNDNLSYAEARNKGRRQDEILMNLCENHDGKEWDLKRIVELMG